MYGALLGDIIGSPYEFSEGHKTKDFPLLSAYSTFTDDSVMTIAVAEALMNTRNKGEEETKAALTASMQKWGRRYPRAGYGGRFWQWLAEQYPAPYNSWGNGSAMRVSATGWLYDTLEETLEKAIWSAEVTHNHPEGIKGAEATAAAIFLARTGKTKEEIKAYIEETFSYDLSRSCDEIRPGYHFDVSCQGSVPEAIICFLEGKDYIDTVRSAVSLGGDTDTQACIAGGIAEAIYEIPEDLKKACRLILKPDMSEVLDRFEEIRKGQ